MSKVSEVDSMLVVLFPWQGFCAFTMLAFQQRLNKRFFGDQLILLRGYSGAFHKDCCHRHVEIINSLSWERMTLRSETSKFGSPHFFSIMKMLNTPFFMWMASFHAATVCITVRLAWKSLLVCKPIGINYAWSISDLNVKLKPYRNVPLSLLFFFFIDYFPLSTSPYTKASSHAKQGINFPVGVLRYAMVDIH